MSITPKQWSEPDIDNEVPDATLRYEVYFNEENGRLYRVVDFIMVQEPDRVETVMMEGDLRGEGKMELYPSQQVKHGSPKWYIVLQQDDDRESPRIAFQYKIFRDLGNPFHRVKNSKPQQTYRGMNVGGSTPSGNQPVTDDGLRTPSYRPPVQRRGASRSRLPSAPEDQESDGANQPGRGHRDIEGVEVVDAFVAQFRQEG